MTAWLRNKYVGMILHDDGDNDKNRRIFKAFWQKQRPKCYMISTGIIKDNGNIDQSDDAQQDYKIDKDLHKILTPDLNPKYSFKNIE